MNKLFLPPCRKCIYCDVYSSQEFDKCQNPNITLTDYCDTARKVENYCGIKGKYFTPQLGIFQKIMKYIFCIPNYRKKIILTEPEDNIENYDFENKTHEDNIWIN